METALFWIDIALWTVTGFGICWLVAAIADELRQVLMAGFGIFYQPAAQGHAAVAGFLRASGSWLKAQAWEEAESGSEGPIYYFIGAVTYTVLTVVFVLCDIGMVLLTCEAMGLEGHIALPMDTAPMSAGALVTVALFWGLVLFDLLGVTRLAPWRKFFSVVTRRICVGLAILFVLLSVSVCVAMAYWRAAMVTWAVPEAAAAVDTGGGALSGLQVEGNVSPIEPVSGDPEPMVDEPEQPAQWAVYYSMMGIAGLSVAATAFSGVGVVMLVKFLLLILSAVALIPVAAVAVALWCIATVLDWIFRFVERLVDLVVAVAERIVGLFRRNGKRRAADAQNGPPPVPEERQLPDDSGPVSDAGFDPFAQGGSS